jgi:lipoprotein-releasing system permease protein
VSDRPQTAPAVPARQAAAPGLPPGEWAGHPTPPVFEPAAFLLALVGLLGTIGLVPVAYPLLADRLALPPQLATGLTAAAAAVLGAAVGAVVAWRWRRLAFYELSAAGLVWGLAASGLALRAASGGALPQVVSGLAAQGTLVLELGLLGLGALAGTAVLTGTSLGYLAAGAGRLDASLSYELYVARSHLRLSPRTLAALFAVVVTGILPGLLVAMAWSLIKDAGERRAYRRGELVARPRMPATLLMTLISIGGVAIGVWALTVVLSVMSGFSGDLKRKILGQTAHGMVLSYGEDDFGDWRAVREQALKVRGVAGATPFLYNEVMLSTGQSVTGAILKGIDPATIGSVTDLPASLESGDLAWLSRPEGIVAAERAEGARPPPGRALPGIVVGRELSRTLRLQVGDQVSVVSPFGDLGPAGPQPKSRPFRVAGIFYSGMYEYDSKFAYIDLPEAQRFFGSDTVTGLELKVTDVDAARGTMARVVFALGGWPYRAKDWGELNRSLFAALQQEKVAMAVILGFIVLVATFTILATLIMMVLEKRREIAVLKSMGAGVPSVMKIFVVEGVVIGGVGALFGLLLGLGTCLLIDKVGIPLNPEIYYVSNLPVVMDGGQFTLVALTALVLSYLATLYPATKAARLHPVDGLRSE